MSYTITTTAGIQLATIQDGTVNASTTSLTLIGKNYAGYGIFLNENYIKLLENFANSTAPSAAITGQLWYDSTNRVLKVYTGTQWKPISSSAAASTAPTNSVTGDLWWDTANAQLKVWSGAAWITVGPAYTATAGTSGAVVETILDTSSGSHVVVKFYISNSVVAILSKDSSFAPQTAISGFTTIKPGLNLISSSQVTDAQFTGDASNAKLLQGIAASAFLRGDQATSTPYVFGVGKLTAGSDLIIDPTPSSEVQIYSNGLAAKDLGLYVLKGGLQTKAIGITASTGAVTVPAALSVGTNAGVTGNLTVTGTANFQGQSVLSNTMKPISNNTINLGESGTKFATVYATTFNGNLNGTAVTAQYADLAERFEADVPMVPGTVVELGGVKEITAAVQELSEAVFGVISTLPGFLLNNGAGTDKTHPAVAVNGRVPVRVIGKVNKGDRLVSAGNGLARAATRNELTAFNVLGRAIANKTTTGEGLVEAIVKLNS